MFNNADSKEINFVVFIMYLIIINLLFSMFSALFLGNFTFNNIVSLALIPFISSSIGMSLTYYFINNKSLKSIDSNKVSSVVILGLAPSIIIGLILVFIL